MRKDDLQCVLIGRDVDIYNDLARLVRKTEPDSRFKQVDLDQKSIASALKRISGSSLIFISDEISFSLELLSDLVWRFNPDAIVVIVTTKTTTVPRKELFNNTQFSKINLHKKNPESLSILQFLIQSAREKSEFRRCKTLLGVSEKRCQWLVESSREAIAFISRDIHWYANSAYLQLFGISSVQELRSIALKDMILPDEHLLFDGFQQNQDMTSGKRRSILISMRKLNGSTFRANAFLIPSVFKGHKCNQLWIREINVLSEADVGSSKSQEVSFVKSPIKSVNQQTKGITQNSNPFSNLLDNQQAVTQLKENNPFEETKPDSKENKRIEAKKVYDQNSLLKGVIRRKEARIVSKLLKPLKQGETDQSLSKHLMISLKVATAQKKGVDELLENLPESFNPQMRSVFWDKVKFTRVMQALLKKDNLDINLMLQINESSVMDENFISWLLPGLERLGDKSNCLTFLIPSNINTDQYKKILNFIRKIKQFNCKIALDSLSINKDSLILLKYAKPEFVRISLPWARQIEGNESQEIKLSSVIRQFERNNIKVIAPCSFSKEMNRLFILSGASFCQERIIKPA